MYTLVIGRAFPAKETGMMGIFEFEQAAALNKYGMSTVYAFCDTRSIKTLRKLNYKEFTIEDVPVYGYHFPIGGVPRPLFDRLKTSKYKELLKKIIKNHGKPSYIHIHFPLITVHEGIWQHLKELNVPIIVTEHWSKVQKKQLEHYRIDFLKILLRDANQYTTVNEELKNTVIDLTNSNKEIEIIPNMISDEFKFVEKSNDDKKFRFIAIGRLVKEKRYAELIQLFHRSFDEIENVELMIVGDGPEKANIKNLIKKLNISHKVILCGFVPRSSVVKLIQESNAYVSASQIETFGVPYIESLACGVPIIGKRNGVIEKLLSNIHYGYFYEDIDELESLLLDIYENKLSFQGELLSQKSIEKYGQENIYNNLMQIYFKARKDYKIE